MKEASTPTAVSGAAGAATHSSSVNATSQNEAQHRFLPVHLAVLRERDIDPDIAWAAGLRSLDFTSEMVRKRWKERNPGQPTYYSTALEIPSHSHDAYGCKHEHKRLRWDERCEWKGIPGADEYSTPIPPYTTAKGDRPPPFVAAALDRVIGDITRPIFITEAALKALCLQTIGLDAVGLAGVEVGAKDPELWGLTKQLAIHPELKRLGWKGSDARGRDGYVSFDAGAQDNPMVALAQARICYVLDDEGATAWIVRLPPRSRQRPEDVDIGAAMWTEFADQGPDDFIHTHGADAYRALVSQAVPGNPLSWVQSIITAHQGQPKDQIGQRLADLLRDMQFVSLLEVFPKATVDQVANEYRRYAAIGKKALKEAADQLRARRAAARDLDKGDDEQPVLFKVGDQAELANHLLAKYTVQMIAPIHDEGSVHQYDPELGVWKIIDDNQLSRDIQALSGAVVAGTRQLSVTNPMIHGTVQCLVAKIRKPGFFADAPRDGVAMRNGYARVTADGVVRDEHSPEHRQRHHYAFDYAPQQKPKRFIEALEYAFRDDDDKQQKIDLLQEFTGICRIGQATRYEQAIFLHGPRADDGKSTVLAILSGTFDAASVACLSPWEIGDRFRLQELVSKTINITDDDRSDMIKYAGLYKSLVTAKNNNFTYERKGKDAEKFRPIAGHIAAVNTLPRADDSTNGWFRRQLVIQFNNQVEPARKRRSYETSILAEEQQSIVCWTLDGACRCVQQNGYTIPPSSVLAVNEWREQSCSAFLFAAEGCTPDETAETKIDVLYTAYLAFCEREGIDHTLKKTTLAAKLVSHRGRTSTSRFYRLVIKTADQTNPEERVAGRAAFEREQEAAERIAQEVADYVGGVLDGTISLDTGAPAQPIDSITTVDAELQPTAATPPSVEQWDGCLLVTYALSPDGAPLYPHQADEAIDPSLARYLRVYSPPSAAIDETVDYGPLPDGAAWDSQGGYFQQSTATVERTPDGLAVRGVALHSSYLDGTSQFLTPRQFRAAFAKHLASQEE